MNKTTLIEAFSNIDDDLTEKHFKEKEALKAKKAKPRKPAWLKWSGIAACLCLCVAIACGVIFLPGMLRNDPPVTLPPDTTTAPTVNPDSSIGGEITKLTADCKTSTVVNGSAVKYTGSLSPSTTSDAPPRFGFNFGGVAVVAKAAEELPDVYETLNNYGSIYTSKYRIFRMTVTDSLESGMDGEFFYALPSFLKGDLTEYDALLISMSQRGNDFILKNTSSNTLTSFSILFCDPYEHPELGSIIAFTNGVFDESLWQDKSWLYGYQFAKLDLDEGSGNDEMLVYRGSTLSDALKKRKELKAEWGQWGKDATVNVYDFKTAEAKAVAEFVKPFVNGVFNQNLFDLSYRRYIGGCPTNEWIKIDPDTEAVTRSEYSFNDEDFADLPDIAAYIESLDLTLIKPQHMNEDGKKLIYNSAMGWYEKTQSGVYSIVRVAWQYALDGNYYKQYYDETFILLEGDQPKVISRDEITVLIGDNRNIWHGEYGKETEIPME